ncbi:hypothetical protein D187_010289 [Cystobacter fuscus DSM 2262]|uniref:Uncharacterized protein n=1 Tax=Cystobacter fuscus (strain ATCC 25194 / DSM 2262 / NBRC 100088 / M29) TaxID=1242864 RepID=S9PB98_CYSF2|nr:hypothetical protein D187_010289 [Cystobacter fuscus DSM 2262]
MTPPPRNHSLPDRESPEVCAGRQASLPRSEGPAGTGHHICSSCSPKEETTRPSPPNARVRTS